MVGHLVPVRIGDVEVQIETVQEPGSEYTSRLPEVGDHVRAAFDSAQDVILGMATRTAHLVERMASSPAAHPAKLEVEFGLGFSARGNVIVASGEANATLKVKLTYEADTA